MWGGSSPILQRWKLRTREGRLSLVPTDREEWRLDFHMGLRESAAPALNHYFQGLSREGYAEFPPHFTFSRGFHFSELFKGDCQKHVSWDEANIERKKALSAEKIKYRFLILPQLISHLCHWCSGFGSFSPQLSSCLLGDTCPLKPQEQVGLGEWYVCGEWQDENLTL